MEKNAILSPCRKYRYFLSRKWADGRVILFFLLNPSTANENEDDNTSLRCIDFSQQWGYGELWMMNLFSIRETYSGLLKQLPGLLVGEDHWHHVLDRIDKADTVIVAWGNTGTLFNADRAFLQSVPHPNRLMCLGLTKLGNPKHPLYLKKDTKLQPFIPRLLRRRR